MASRVRCNSCGAEFRFHAVGKRIPACPRCGGVLLPSLPADNLPRKPGYQIPAWAVLAFLGCSLMLATLIVVLWLRFRSTELAANSDSSAWQSSEHGDVSARARRQGAPTNQPLGAWNVEVDPSREMPDWGQAEQTVAGGFDAQFSTSDISFPESPSVYAAICVFGDRGAALRVIDIRSGKPIHEYSVPQGFQISLTALSPDGQYTATFDDLRGGESHIQVAEAASGRTILDAPFESGEMPLEIAFAGSNRLLAIIFEATQGWRVESWEVPSGRPLGSSLLPTPEKGGLALGMGRIHLAISPGGRYFAVRIGTVIRFYEVSTLEVVGEANLGDKARRADFTRIAFSPQGHLVVFVTSKHLWTVDVATGRSSDAVELQFNGSETPTSFFNCLPLQYVPEIDCLLLNGSLLFDRSSGAAVHRVTGFKGSARVLPGARLVGLRDAQDRANRQQTIGEYQLPQEEILAVARSFQSGGSLLDGLLGPAETWDAGAIRSISFAPHDSIPWNIKPSTGPAVVDPVKPYRLPWRDTNSLVSAGGPILSASGNWLAWIPPQYESPSRLYVADMRSGEIACDLEVLPKSYVVDVSPDGTYVLVEVPRFHPATTLNSTRLEIYSVAEKRHAVAVGGAPYSERVNPFVASRTEIAQFLKAVLVSETLLLTCDANSRGVLWNLPEAKPTLVMHGVTDLIGLSPDRRIAMVYNSILREIRFVDLSTGQWCGQCKVDDAGTLRIAFSPTGGQLALVNISGAYSLISLRQTADGAVVKEIACMSISGDNPIVTWFDQRFLLVGSVLVDLECGAPTWRVQPRGRCLAAPGGMFWELEFRGSEPNLLHISPRPILQRSDLGKIETLTPQPAKPLIGPGSRVAIHVNNGIATTSAQDAHRIVSEQLNQRGWIVDPQASLHLQISGQPEQRAGRMSGPTNTSTWNVTYQIIDHNNRKLWSRTFEAKADSPLWMLTGNIHERVNSPFTPIHHNPLPRFVFGVGLSAAGSSE